MFATGENYNPAGGSRVPAGELRRRGGRRFTALSAVAGVRVRSAAGLSRGPSRRLTAMAAAATPTYRPQPSPMINPETGCVIDARIPEKVSDTGQTRGSRGLDGQTFDLSTSIRRRAAGGGRSAKRSLSDACGASAEGHGGYRRYGRMLPWELANPLGRRDPTLRRCGRRAARGAGRWVSRAAIMAPGIVADAGGVGSIAVQLARQIGSRVIGTGRAADRDRALVDGGSVARRGVAIRNEGVLVRCARIRDRETATPLTAAHPLTTAARRPPARGL